MMSPEQFGHFMNAILGQIQAAPTVGPGNQQRRRRLEPKGFSRFDKFSGGEEKSKDWAYDFKVATQAQSEKMEAAMRKVERAGEHSMAELLEQDNAGVDNGAYEGI